MAATFASNTLSVGSFIGTKDVWITWKASSSEGKSKWISCSLSMDARKLKSGIRTDHSQGMEIMVEVAISRDKASAIAGMESKGVLEPIESAISFFMATNGRVSFEDGEDGFR